MHPEIIQGFLQNQSSCLQLSWSSFKNHFELFDPQTLNTDVRCNYTGAEMVILGNLGPNICEKLCSFPKEPSETFGLLQL